MGIGGGGALRSGDLVIGTSGDQKTEKAEGYRRHTHEHEKQPLGIEGA